MRSWLIELRKKKRLTQKEISTECGMTRQYYGLIENGVRNVPVKTAKKIAKVLGFDWKIFYDDREEGDKKLDDGFEI